MIKIENILKGDKSEIKNFNSNQYSVVIEELTKWKTVLWSRNEDLQICINGLLDEMGRIQRNFRQTSTYVLSCMFAKIYDLKEL